MSAVSFRSKPGRRDVTLSLTSLIDVLFLLIIFFMLTGTFKRVGELELSLPDSSTSAPQSGEGAATHVELVAMENGELSVDGTAIEKAEVLQALSALYREDSSRRVMIQAEAGVPHGEVVFLLDQVRESGFAGAGIGTHISNSAVGAPAGNSESSP